MVNDARSAMPRNRYPVGDEGYGSCNYHTPVSGSAEVGKGHARRMICHAINRCHIHDTQLFVQTKFRAVRDH